MTASSDLKYTTTNKETFDLLERYDGTELELNTKKTFFSDNYVIDVFLVITAIISLLATTLTVYLLCKHKKL